MLFSMTAAAYAAAPAVGQKEAATVDRTYPNLVSGALSYATLGDLSEGQILKSGSLTISLKDLAAEIEKAPESSRPALKKSQLFLLDQMVTRRLLLQLAREKKAPSDTKSKYVESSGAEEQEIQEYLKVLVSGAKVTDQEVAAFYEANKDLCGGAPLAQMKDQLKAYVLQQKQQELANEHIRTLGQRQPITLAAAWTKAQAALAMDNPVDKARKSGLPSMVDFGASGCVPCEMMTPVLADLKKKFAGKVNVMFVHVREEEVLAARYKVEAIPVQVFFDKDGKEVFRHVGFFAQAEIEKKLAEIGVK
jgi:thioredoxin 1